MMKLFLKKIIIKGNLIFQNFFFFFLPNFRNLKNIIGRPVLVEQKLKIRGLGKVSIGSNCFFGTKIGGRSYGETEFLSKFIDSKIIIGNNVATNNNLFICAANSITIGDDTVIGERVTIFDFEGHGLRANERKKIGQIGSVLLAENIWIGNNVIILKNTNIGKNSIIAAGAVVSGTFPENVIIGGIPAKIIKEIPS